MKHAPSQANVYRFLFRMAARAAELDAQEFLTRLVTGIANRYGASACSIYRYGRQRATAWAPPAEDVLGLKPEERAYIHNLDGRLVQESMSQQGLVSALDLDVDGDVADLLHRRLPGMDIFAFPLLVEAGPRGAIVMYLPAGSTALGDADLQALMAIGEVLDVAEDQQERLRVGQQRVQLSKAEMRLIQQARVPKHPGKSKAAS